MKLTNSIKDAIIHAVMGDTPHEYSPDQRDKDAVAVSGVVAELTRAGFPKK